MSIEPRDIFSWIGPFSKYGAGVRRVAPPSKGGEDLLPVFTRAAPNAYFFNRDGNIRGAGTNIPRIHYADGDGDGAVEPYYSLELPRTNVVLHNRDLTITHQLTVTAGAGTFTDGETVTATGGGTGVYVLANSSSTLYAIRGGSGAFTGTLTGGSSGATKTISSSATVWVRTTMTPLKTQAGIDGTANSATKLTAGGANSTLLQAITLASSARFETAYLKRITGSGNIQMTTDNGATWTTVGPLTTSWVAYSIPTQTLANPTVGFRIVTNGDEIAVDFFQNENSGLFATSPIPTTTASVTRAVDQMYQPHYWGPMASSFYMRFLEKGTVGLGGNARIFNIGADTATGARLGVESSGSFYQVVYSDGTTTRTATLAAAPTAGQLVELLVTLTSAGVVSITQSIASGATTTAPAAALALPSAWGGYKMWLNSLSTTNAGAVQLGHLVTLRGSGWVHSDFRTLIA